MCSAKVTSKRLHKSNLSWLLSEARHPGTFHAFIVQLSDLYPTGIPVIEFLLEWEGWSQFHCFPLYLGPTILKLHDTVENYTVVFTLIVCV